MRVIPWCWIYWLCEIDGLMGEAVRTPWIVADLGESPSDEVNILVAVLRPCSVKRISMPTTKMSISKRCSTRLIMGKWVAACSLGSASRDGSA